MKEEEKLLQKYGRRSPLRVPDGYFDSLAGEVAAKLGDYPEKPVAAPLSRWQRLKPYVYLAAMFAGIWCMMQVFHHAAGVGSLSLDNPPEQLAEYVAQAPDEIAYMMPASISDDELLEEVGSEYSDIEDFEADFGYEISPRYDDMTLN